MTALVDEAYEKASAGVGKVQEIRIGVLDERALQRFALVVGHADGPYQDAAAAADLGYAGLLAAPLYLTAVLGWDTGPAESDLLADGNSRTPLGDVDVAGLRLMGGGQDLTFHEPVVAGLDVVMHAQVTAVTRKDGRSGPLLVIEVHRRYLEAGDGRLLVECHESFLAR
ncbi:FAS1-like dehydratase domain-containing protein [Pseudonocardia dioxanivorans]|uniref:FAS1-like dehydratase domain-containing protein n=1 Tax=Pseudonocardia dioxanivorans TaxID=240495 RepID=UPI00131A59C7|nr:MaoC family dehydratase N-terminal domain-containing protein [Pseudonocardia dioxanivorans]